MYHKPRFTHKTDGAKQAKAATFLYSDRIQKENSKVPILKIINLKNPGIIGWINGLGRKRWVLLWTELILLLVLLSALLEQ